MTAVTERTTPPDDDVLRARGLHFAHGSTPALADVSLSLARSEIVAVTGPRGSGKTTLLKCLSGQLVPSRGEVWCRSGALHTLSDAARERLRRHRFGWIGTRPELVPELTAWENVALPLLLSGEPQRDARRVAHEWLERLDAAGVARDRPRCLPQSQRQRVAIARALAGGPDVVFADEPTAPLHRADGLQVLRTLTAAARSHGIAVVLAGQEGDAAATGAADRVVELIDGRRTGGADAALSPVAASDAAGTPGASGPSGPSETAETAEASCSVSA